MVKNHALAAAFTASFTNADAADAASGILGTVETTVGVNPAG